MEKKKGAGNSPSKKLKNRPPLPRGPPTPTAAASLPKGKKEGRDFCLGDISKKQDSREERAEREGANLEPISERKAARLSRKQANARERLIRKKKAEGAHCRPTRRRTARRGVSAPKKICREKHRRLGRGVFAERVGKDRSRQGHFRMGM